MSQDVTFVGTYTIPEGTFEAWTTAIRDMVDFVKTNSPRLISFNVYVSADKTEATTIYVHPDSDSLEQHLGTAASRINSGTQMVRVKGIDLYGPASDGVVARLRGISEASTSFPVNVKQHFYGA